MKKKTKEILKELLRKENLLFFSSAILVLLTWNFLPNNIISKIIKLIVFSFFIGIHCAKNERKFKKSDGLFEKMTHYYIEITFALFALGYIFIIFNLISFAGMSLIIAAYIVGITVFYSRIKSLKESKGLKQIIISYVGVSFSTILLFSMIFASISFGENKIVFNGEKNLTSWDYTYFSSNTFYSLSYGDYYPSGKLMQIFSQFEAVLSSIIHIIILGWLINTRIKK